MQPEAIDTRDRIFHLRRQFKPRHRAAGGLLEVTPWVDVVLLVILFFMIQSATLKKPGLEVNLPAAHTTTGSRYDALVLTVPAEDTFYFIDERLPWAELFERLRDAASAHPGRELIIEADDALTYRSLTSLYNLAVEAGWKKVFLATRLERTPNAPP